MHFSMWRGDIHASHPAYAEEVPDLRDISLTQLVYFARCAELSSMKEAAASLHVAQSACPRRSANLERRLGAPLFVRRRAKGLVLTAAGETFLIRTRRILADIDDAMAAVDPGQRDRGGCG